jgi:hypothetical protein
MVSYKTQYLAMKLKYINAKNKLKAGSSGISIDLPKPAEPRLHGHIHKHDENKEHNHGHWHKDVPQTTTNLEKQNHIQNAPHTHKVESYFDANNKKKTRPHPIYDPIVSRSRRPSSSPSRSPSASPRSMPKVSSDIQVAKEALMSIGLNDIEAEMALADSERGDLNEALSNLVEKKRISPLQRRIILKQQQGNVTQPQQQGNVTQPQQQGNVTQPQQQGNVTQSQQQGNVTQSQQPQIPSLNTGIDEDLARSSKDICKQYHYDPVRCGAIPNCQYRKNGICAIRPDATTTKPFKGPIRKYI